MESPAHVILLHGLGRTRYSMMWLGRRLRKEGFDARTFGYRSLRRTIAEHAEDLRRFIAQTYPDGTPPLNFVTHSLGSIVVRRFLIDHPGTRVHRVVMLGPPNQGSSFARRLRPIRFVRAVMGPSFLEVCELDLPPPPSGVEIGIISGGTSGERGMSPLVSGNNDGIVSVREAALAGSRDHVIVRGMHSFLMYQPLITREVARFLREGSFSETLTRHLP